MGDYEPTTGKHGWEYGGKNETGRGLSVLEGLSLRSYVNRRFHYQNVAILRLKRGGTRRRTGGETPGKERDLAKKDYGST